jgi:hypothetical protein
MTLQIWMKIVLLKKVDLLFLQKECLFVCLFLCSIKKFNFLFFVSCYILCKKEQKKKQKGNKNFGIGGFKQLFFH